MKKIILAISCIAGLSLSASAQFLRFGVKGGLTGTFSEFQSTSSHENLKNELGIGGYVGGQAEVSFKNKSDKFKMQLEVLGNFNSLRNEIGTMTLMTANSKMDVYSISVPILAKYFFQPNFSLYLGPTFNFNLHAKHGMKPQTGNEWVYSNSDDINKALNPFQVGGMIGANYYIKKGFYVEARYQMIMPDVTTNNIAHPSPEYGAINNISVGVGYKFRNKAK
ncbi:MAG TPA: porin family protein [Edaphocola sp.]|nr:porin family protein [Edaphocola sp.]